jgi:putative transposase
MANYKRIFLEGYSYFITVVTHRRNPILLENIELLRRAFKESKLRYDYTIDAIVIMPDHFHMIITPKHSEEYPKIVSVIKRYFTRHCEQKYYAHLEQSASRHQRGMKPVWQKRFYEHTIRNDKDMHATLQYMYHNPVKHQHTDDPKTWQYSSFNTNV